MYPFFVDTLYIIKVRWDVADGLYTKKGWGIFNFDLIKHQLLIHFLIGKDIEIENQSIFSTINQVWRMYTYIYKKKQIFL